MAAGASLYAEIAARMNAQQQRFTPSRRQIVEVLAARDRPLSIPEILEATPEVAQSSAYRNIAVLEKAGVVTRVMSSDEWARFELAEDLIGHHHHLMCAGCGVVQDIVVPDSIEHELDKTLAVVAKRAGFLLQHHRLDLIGMCASCQ